MPRRAQPKHPTGEPTIQVYLRLPYSLRNRLVRLAEVQQESMMDLMVHAIEAEVQRMEHKS